ncbi:MAG TPA: peptidoglycan-binding domain-containing protein [Gaiellaceae bacterium]|nr:peptidoglycan-binding domain-containing protein [Gaiellaceae bacterium]
MPDEDSQVTLEAAHHESADQDPRDDWLGGTPELEWFPDGEASREAPRRRGVVSVRGRGAKHEYALDPALRRRRLVAAVAVVGLVIAVVVIALVAFGGGSGKPLTPTTPTTPLTTTTSTTTTRSGRTKTPVTHPSTSLKLVLPASGKLTLGDTGSAVKTLQKALVKLGSGALTADGNFGSLTERAVAAFQQAHGLTGDGVVGAKTAAAINAALAAG